MEIRRSSTSLQAVVVFVLSYKDFAQPTTTSARKEKNDIIEQPQVKEVYHGRKGYSGGIQW
jgi:hypothetical protein